MQMTGRVLKNCEICKGLVDNSTSSPSGLLLESGAVISPQNTIMEKVYNRKGTTNSTMVLLDKN